ncbi:MAG: hypothetical protein ACRD1U_09680 [Vicinamibacterales bacterium]
MQARGAAIDDGFVDSTDKSESLRPEPRPADWKSVDDALTLLARAVQQFHTYPATSPLCINAIEAVRRALAALDREQLTFRVTPVELLVDDVPTGRGTQVGQELGKRLHRAAVASVTLERGASARELARFCQDLVRCGERGAGGLSLVEMLAEHGLDRVSVAMASRPEVLDVPPIAHHTADEMGRERARFEAQIAKGGIVNHLYPPQKAWVRLDPGQAPRSVSLLDLAVLADDPATLASMLLRLTDDSGNVPAAEALETKYSDVATLISGLDPRVARRMFGKLARAVLDLDPGARQALLRRTVLPGLLEGRVDGAILRDFPNVDLAESLCLLLDLETAAPELLGTALARLDLTPDRHAAMLPLLDEQLKAREAAAADDDRQTTLTRHARELIRVDGRSGKTFAEFAAFDLSLDAHAQAVLDDIRTALPQGDVVIDQITCLWHLVCLEPNPETVQGFVKQSFALLSAIEAEAHGASVPVAASREEALAGWLVRYGELAERLRATRPDVADVLMAGLSAFCTPDRVARLVDLSAREDQDDRLASTVIAALGPALAGPLVDLIDREQSDRTRSGADAKPDGRSLQGRGKAAAQLLVQHAARLAPALAPRLAGSTPGVKRVLLRALGAAGAGYEDVIGGFIAADDEQTAREALRALARIGTSRAAGIVVAEIARQHGALSVAAEETLWHFPPQEAQRRMRELLGRRDFTLSHPHTTGRLLDRAASTGCVDLGPVLHGLAPMRFRIWKPAVARMARKAYAMLKR